MKKQKLINARLSRNLSQQSVADLLFMHVSNYSRRERGTKDISLDEWGKIAQILEIPVEDIYESGSKYAAEHSSFIEKVKSIETNLYPPDSRISKEVKQLNEDKIWMLEEKVNQLEKRLNASKLNE